MVRTNNQFTSCQCVSEPNLKGGGEVCGYATEDPPLSERAYLSGVIGSSPMFTQAKPAGKVLRVAGDALSRIFPDVLFPAEVPAEVTICLRSKKRES